MRGDRLQMTVETLVTAENAAAPSLSLEKDGAFAWIVAANEARALLLLVGVLLFIAKGSAIAPFIYTLF